METNTTPSPENQAPKKGNGKTLAIVIILIILALLGYFMFGQKGKKESADSARSTEVKSQSQATSLKELAMGGKPQQCEVNQQTEGMSTAGKFYMSAGKMRGDYTTTVNGKTVESHFVMDGEYMTSWTSESGMGVKMKIDQQANAQSQPPQGSAEFKTDLQQKMDYNCQNWSADNSKFEVPSNIKFVDYTQMMGAGAGASAGSSVDVKARQCAACESLTGDTKAQCIAALSCK